MKTTAKENTVTPDEYPCLKKANDGRIVLFCAPKMGAVVHIENTGYLGHQSECWNEDNFTLWHGSVTLEN